MFKELKEIFMKIKTVWCFSYVPNIFVGFQYGLKNGFLEFSVFGVSQVLKTMSKGKFLKYSSKILVKPVDTKSLINGLSTTNPGCQAVLMIVSSTFSGTK